MEKNDVKEILIMLCKNKKKTCISNIIAKIKDIKSNNENDEIEVTIENKHSFKGMILIKGNIFPIAKDNDNIKITKFSLIFDEKFDLKIYLEGELISKSNFICDNNNCKREVYDLTSEKIVNTLKELLNINKNTYSNLFRIIDIDDCYYLKCIIDGKIYKLNFDSKFFNYLFKKNDFVYVINYYIESENKIELTEISLTQVLDDEKLFILLHYKKFLKEKIFVGKIVDFKSPDVNVILSYNNIYYLKNKDFNYALCKFCLISNYIINEDEIKIKNDSFVYLSEQEIYFSKKIYLNYFSVIKFYFYDFIEDINLNYYNLIQIEKHKKYIKEKEMYFIITSDIKKYFEYYPIKISLISEKKNQTLNYKFFLFHGLLNKINAFINYCESNSFFYEFFYYNFNQKEDINKKEIIINNKVIDIINFDNYDSLIRKRFNVLNIPYQGLPSSEILKNINEKNQNGKNNDIINYSFQICELINENIKNSIFGVFDMNEIDNKLIEKKDNDEFDSEYINFGNIYDRFFEDCLNKDKKNILISMCTGNFIHYLKKIGGDQKSFLSIISYNENITLSQFKTRIGLLIAYYLYIQPNQNAANKICNKIFTILLNLRERGENISLFDKLRIFTCLFKNILLNNINYELELYSELSENSPYLVAKNFNIQEIVNMNEFSKLFLAYLQMDNYILTNLFYSNKSSYSLSVEPLFILKHHLLETYKDFFLIEFDENDEFASHQINEGITVINEKNLFPDEIGQIYDINDEKLLKNYAFPISLENRHENNSHQKRHLKSFIVNSPTLYCKDGKVMEYNYKGKNCGEDGRIIEKFIDEDEYNIYELKKLKIFGELLDYKLFIQKDFKEFHKIRQKIINNNNKSKDILPNLEENKNKKADQIEFEKYNEKKLNYEKYLSKKGIIKNNDLYITEEEKKVLDGLNKKCDFFKLPNSFKMMEKYL